MFDVVHRGEKPAAIDRIVSEEGDKKVASEEKVGQAAEIEAEKENRERREAKISRRNRTQNKLRVGIFRFNHSFVWHTPLIFMLINRKLALFRVKEEADMPESQLGGEVI